MASLPFPRRIVTGHDDKGQAIFLSDKQIPLEAMKAGGTLGVLWETREFPANNSGNDDPADRRTTDLANKDGVILRVVDLNPGITKVRDQHEWISENETSNPARSVRPIV